MANTTFHDRILKTAIPGSTGPTNTMSTSARRLRDSTIALAGVYALAAVATLPVAQTITQGGAFGGSEPGRLAIGGWFVACSVLAGYVCIQFLAARPDATEWLATNPESTHDESYVYLRAVIKRPFTLFAMGVWLVLLALVAPMLDIGMVFSLLAGIVGLAAGITPMQPFSGPDVHG